jgi:hypothetical protein
MEEAMTDTKPTCPKCGHAVVIDGDDHHCLTCGADTPRVAFTSGHQVGKSLRTLGKASSKVVSALFKTEEQKDGLSAALKLPRWALFPVAEGADAYEDIELDQEAKAMAERLLDALGVPPEFRKADTTHATSSLRLAELERMQARDQGFMRDVLMSDDAFIEKVRAMLDAVPEEDRVYYESTPHPGDAELLDRIASGRLSEISMGSYVPPPWTATDCPVCSPAQRCSGCGKTPCVPDSRGCCPNRPDEPDYMDDSWGDYETEQET